MVRLNEFVGIQTVLVYKVYTLCIFFQKMLIEPRLVVSKFNFKIEFNFSASSVQAR